MTVEDVSVSNPGDMDAFRRVLRYPAFLLKVCGAYVELGEPRHYGCTQIAHLVYCITLGIFTWADNVRYLVAVFDETQVERLMSMGVFLIYYLVNSFYLTLCLKVLTSKMPEIYEKFRSYQRHHRLGFAVWRWERNLKILTTSVIIYYIIGGTASVVFYNLGVLSENSIVHKLLFPFKTLQEGRFLLIGACLLVIKNFILTAMFHNWFYILFYLVCRILQLEYCELKKGLKKFLQNSACSDDITSSADDKISIEDYRRHHFAITDLVTATNDVIQHMAGMQYAVSLPVLCVILYGIIYGKLVLEDMIILSSYSLLYLFSMVHLTFTAAALNQEAHSSYDVLYPVDTGHLPIRTVLQIQLFLSRLKGPPIGVNLYGLFTIDSTTILMLFGTLLTYGIIVLQMAPIHSNATSLPCSVHNTSDIVS